MEPKKALQFSGGKDSLVTLHLFRDKLDEILVTWINTGAAYPDTIRQMAELKAQVPHFLEIKSNQPAQIAEWGYPADVVPLHFTLLGRRVRETKHPYVLQDTYNCCAANLWKPMQDAMKERGITTIIRGQRISEKYKTWIRSGHVEDGITYIFPLENWSEAQVFAYLRENKIPIPDYYATEMHSRDCWNCTGYMDEAAGRIGNLPPLQQKEVLRRLREIDAAVKVEHKYLEDILEQHKDK